MTFIWPTMLLALLLLPLLVAFYVRLQRLRRRQAANYGSLGLVREAAGRRLGWRRHLPPACFLLGLALVLAALARPQATISTPRVEGTVILAFDVSGSMAADDLKPTRMEAAKVAARSFVDRQPRTVQIGVVSFSDAGLSVQTPTDDRDAVKAAIDRLAPARGTSLGSGILAALTTIDLAEGNGPPRFYTNQTPMAVPTPTPVPKGSHSSAVIVLLSDGESNAPPNPRAAAQTAADRGVRIYTIGVGSAAGATLKVEGFNVHTQLDEDLLKEIAQRTDGTYYNAGTAQDLRSVYERLGSHVVVKPVRTEVTAAFSGAGLLVLLIGGALSLLWFSRLP